MEKNLKFNLSLPFFAIFLFIFIISFQININLALGTEASTIPTSSNNSNNTVQLNNPLTGNTSSKSIPELLGTIINYAMGIIGSLALVMFIYGGITWMLSGGNQDQVTKGKNTIMWAALGIAIIFTSYVVVRFIITAISGAT